MNSGFLSDKLEFFEEIELDFDFWEKFTTLLIWRGRSSFFILGLAGGSLSSDSSFLFFLFPISSGVQYFMSSEFLSV